MYKLQQNPEFVTRLDDMASIRIDVPSWDSQKYQEWLADGNTPVPIDPVPAKTKAERIAEKLESVNATDEWQIQGAAAGMLALYIAQGKTEADAYAESPLYHKAKDVMNEIDAIRAEP